MKFLILSFVAIIVCVSAVNVSKSKFDKSWEHFKTVHAKSYKNEKEETLRKEIFEKNSKFISGHNLEYVQGKVSFTVKMNQFGDLTNEEFASQMGFFNMTKKPSGVQYQPSNVEIPDAVDWRTQGYVTPIRNQLQCGSSPYFSAVVALEGQHFKATGNLVVLSPQQIIDCSSSFGNQGCNGGFMDQSFQYIQANKGLDTDKSYPYKGVEQKCAFVTTGVGATVSGLVDILAGDEAALTNALATIGPIASAVDASQSSFQFYSSGVYSDPQCSKQPDHGIAIVGYGVQDGKDYYILKNQWDVTWGEKGYMQLARNQDNMCGIAQANSYPLV